MSHKQEALDEIAAIALRHGLSAQEIIVALQGAGGQRQQKSSRTIASIFAYIGGVLMLGGIAVLVNMQWDYLGPQGHVLITLGPGFAAFLLGVLCASDRRAEKAATPFFLLAVALEPSGILIALEEYAHGDNPEQGVLFMCFIMLLQQGLAFLALRRTALAFTTIVFGLNFVATALDIQEVTPRYIGLVVGGAQLCLAYALDKSRHAAIAPVNYFFGSVIFLSGFGAMVAGTSIELSFLGLACATIYASVLARSRVLLINGVLAMLGFIGYYSQEYFAQTIGWPITLIVSGGVMVALGVIAVKINKTYIAQKSSS